MWCYFWKHKHLIWSSCDWCPQGLGRTCTPWKISWVHSTLLLILWKLLYLCVDIIQLMEWGQQDKSVEWDIQQWYWVPAGKQNKTEEKGVLGYSKNHKILTEHKKKTIWGKWKLKRVEETVQNKLYSTKYKCTWALTVIVLWILSLYLLSVGNLSLIQVRILSWWKAATELLRAFPNFLVHPLSFWSWPLLGTILPLMEAQQESRLSSVFSLLFHFSLRFLGEWMQACTYSLSSVVVIWNDLKRWKPGPVALLPPLWLDFCP